MTKKEAFINEAKEKAKTYQGGRARWWLYESRRRELNTTHLNDDLELKAEGRV